MLFNREPPEVNFPFPNEDIPNDIFKLLEEDEKKHQRAHEEFTYDPGSISQRGVRLTPYGS